MEYLPTRGWSDVATRADLDHLAALTKRDLEVFESRLGARIDAMGTGLGARIDASHLQLSETLSRELGHMYKELAAHTRTTVFARVGSVMTSTALAFAATNL